MSSTHLSLVISDDDPTTDATPLAAAVTDMAEAMHAASGTGAVLDQLVAAALQLVPGAQDASVMVVQRKDVASQHATSTVVEQVDAYQLEVGEGPCLEAVSRERAVRVTDMGQEARWEVFAPRARQLGVGSSLSLPLRSGTTLLGVLNLFSRQVAAFDSESEQVGLLLTSHAAIALAHAHEVGHLARAVAGRDVIGQAKGRLMERYQVDEERAFGVLRRVSQNTHRKLHDVAHELATTGELAALVEAQAEGRDWQAPRPPVRPTAPPRPGPPMTPPAGPPPPRPS